jgi:transposase-like protein
MLTAVNSMTKPFHDSKNPQYTVQSHAVRKEVRENQSTPCPNNISTPLSFFIYTCSAFTFFAYPSEICKAIYATKAIKSLKMENTLIDQKRKVFPTEMLCVT